MRDDKLSVQSMDFAVQIINLVKSLKEKRESIISNQIGRSGTSIGANIHEAQYAHGKADFIQDLDDGFYRMESTVYRKNGGVNEPMAYNYKSFWFCTGTKRITWNRARRSNAPRTGSQLPRGWADSARLRRIFQR